jgi:hypothetical protein
VGACAKRQRYHLGAATQLLHQMMLGALGAYRLQATMTVDGAHEAMFTAGVDLIQQLMAARHAPQRALLCMLPPRPEFDPDVAGEPAGHEIDDPPTATQDLGVPRHLGLEEEGSVIDRGGHQDRVHP